MMTTSTPVAVPPPLVAQPSQLGAAVLTQTWAAADDNTATTQQRLEQRQETRGRGRVVFSEGPQTMDDAATGDDRTGLLAIDMEDDDEGRDGRAGGGCNSKYESLAWLPKWAKVLLVLVAMGMFAVMLWYTITYTFNVGAAMGMPTRARKNLIFMVSDGFGPASQTMARQYQQSMKGLPMDFQLPLDKIFVGSSRTRSSDSLVTDSAAGATAFSCAIKTYNGAIAVDDDRLPCATILEGVALSGYYTGLVATSRITHATPASFAAHVVDRDLENDIAVQEIGNTALGVQPDLLLGGGRRHFIPQSQQGSVRTDDVDVLREAQLRGYRVITSRADFDTLPRDASGAPTLGVFTLSDLPYELDRVPESSPSLFEMAAAALDILTAKVDTDPSSNGFFLMIEGSRIDHAAHDNDPATHLGEILMYNSVVEHVQRYVDNHPDTILISTSDHECGGLTVARQVQAAYPDYLWYPEVLSKVKNSTSSLSSAIKAYASTGASDLSAYITNIVVNQLGISDMTEGELSMLVSLALSTESTSQGDLTYALGNMVSLRAQLGWTTHGHSAVDVNLYAYGPESTIMTLRGNHENTDVGEFFINYFGVKLQPLTDTLKQAERSRDAPIPADYVVDEYHKSSRRA